MPPGGSEREKTVASASDAAWHDRMRDGRCIRIAKFRASHEPIAHSSWRICFSEFGDTVSTEHNGGRLTEQAPRQPKMPRAAVVEAREPLARRCGALKIAYTGGSGEDRRVLNGSLTTSR